jgi:hypothetical protein
MPPNGRSVPRRSATLAGGGRASASAVRQVSADARKARQDAQQAILNSRKAEAAARKLVRNQKANTRKAEAANRRANRKVWINSLKLYSANQLNNLYRQLNQQLTQMVKMGLSENNLKSYRNKRNNVNTRRGMQKTLNSIKNAKEIAGRYK